MVEIASLCRCQYLHLNHKKEVFWCSENSAYNNALTEVFIYHRINQVMWITADDCRGLAQLLWKQPCLPSFRNLYWNTKTLVTKPAAASVLSCERRAGGMASGPDSHSQKVRRCSSGSSSPSRLLLLPPEYKALPEPLELTAIGMSHSWLPAASLCNNANDAAEKFIGCPAEPDLLQSTATSQRQQQQLDSLSHKRSLCLRAWLWAQNNIFLKCFCLSPKRFTCSMCRYTCRYIAVIYVYAYI